jgi:hypothetical protein
MVLLYVVSKKRFLLDASGALDWLSAVTSADARHAIVPQYSLDRWQKQVNPV